MGTVIIVNKTLKTCFREFKTRLVSPCYKTPKTVTCLVNLWRGLATLFGHSQGGILVQRVQRGLSTMDREKIEQRLPHYARGEIVKGFGRGSRELGFPTANFSEEVIEKLPSELVGGIYFGFAKVD